MVTRTRPGVTLHVHSSVLLGLSKVTDYVPLDLSASTVNSAASQSQLSPPDVFAMY